MKKAIFNWSGGKDSSLCLFHVQGAKKYDVNYLFTTINERYQRISMHGVRVSLLEKQARSINIPLIKMMVSEMPSMSEYNDQMEINLNKFTEKGIRNSIYGDIFLEDLKLYREAQLAKINMKGIFPLWQRSTTDLLDEFIREGFKAIIVCVNERYLDKSFVGREIDQSLKDDLPKGVDPCGENGEFHSFVYNGPIFSFPIECQKGEIVYKKYKSSNANSDSDTCSTDTNYDSGFWYCDLL